MSELALRLIGVRKKRRKLKPPSLSWWVAVIVIAMNIGVAVEKLVDPEGTGEIVRALGSMSSVVAYWPIATRPYAPFWFTSMSELKRFFFWLGLGVALGVLSGTADFGDG